MSPCRTQLVNQFTPQCCRDKHASNLRLIVRRSRGTSHPVIRLNSGLIAPEGAGCLSSVDWAAFFCTAR
jgi:hypothetical protein